MNIDIMKGVILNVGMLILIALLLARTRMVKKFIIRDKHTIKEQSAMIFIFGAISILCTYMGVGVRGAIANTRVIGVMAGGFLGGPVVGIGAAIIAGMHRYAIDINGLTGLACAISTTAEGILAASFSNYVKKGKYKETHLFLLTFLAEVMQMIIILIIAKPYEEALALVREIAVPMILFNSAGLVLFVSIFKHILVEQENEIGKKVGLTLEITQKCLPLLRKGLYNEQNCKKIEETILEYAKDIDIIFTDKEMIISSSVELPIPKKKDHALPEIVQMTINEKKLCIAEDATEQDILYKVLDKMVAISAPLTKNGEVFGCLILLTNKYKISLHSDIEFTDGLSKLFSVQIELSQIEKQKLLLQKAEFNALQSQINPHFIFNSLNTISAFCREKPDKARELLIALATYFRNSIQTQDGFVSIYDEMNYVEAYLQLEKARFDDRLQVTIDIPDDLECEMPCLILQPLVENAVNHGAMKRKKGEVKIIVEKEINGVRLFIIDNGHGIPQHIIDGLKNNTLDRTKIGLSNVEKRLRYIYAKENGLDILSTPEGTTIQIFIPFIKP